MKPSKICVLASGGIESSALLYLAARRYRQVFPLYVSHGFFWEATEIHWLRRYLRKLGQRSVQPLTVCPYPLRPQYREHWSFSGERVPSAASQDEAVFLPGRNVLLLTLAAVFCYSRKISRIAIGTLKGNPFPDSSPLFFRAMAKALSRGLDFPIKIECPFRHLEKRGVLRLASGAPLDLTFSCLQPRGWQPCGRCNKCAERLRALKAMQS